MPTLENINFEDVKKLENASSEDVLRRLDGKDIIFAEDISLRITRVHITDFEKDDGTVYHIRIAEGYPYSRTMRVPDGEKELFIYKDLDLFCFQLEGCAAKFVNYSADYKPSSKGQD